MSVEPRGGKLRPAIVLIAGFVFGALIWWVSPTVTGHVEAWDAKGVYYPLSLVVAGVVAALLSPRHFVLAPVGIYLGQFAYAMVFLSGGPLWIAGLVFGVLYCTLAFAGSAIVFGCWYWARNA
jgi:hypothetical protein